MLKDIGAPELIIVAVVVLILFGGKKIPEFFKGISQAVGEFRKGASPNKVKAKDEDNA